MKLILVLQMTLFIIGSILGNFNALPIAIKILLSSSFLISALYIWRKNKHIYSKYAFFAMVFCFLGDLTLMGVIKGGNIIGMMFFGIAHSLFMICFMKTIKISKKRVFRSSVIIAMVVYYSYFLTIWWVVLKNLGYGNVFTIGSLIYGLLIGTMAALAFSLYKSNKQYIFVAIGAFCFLLSDSIIAITQGVSIKGSGIIIWFTYSIALCGIIYSQRLQER